jgi:cell division inhibitor SulA/protein ImuA
MAALLLDNSESGHPAAPMPALAGKLQDKKLQDKLWRACDLPGRQVRRAGIGTGFPLLDAELADRGWPRAGLAELLCTSQCSGELRLLAPALAELSCLDSRAIAWVAPPYIPYAPALAAAGIDLARLLLIYPQSHRDALWALEQALCTGACSAVLGWLAESRLRFAEVRRLQLAAVQGRTWGCLFRPARAARDASAAQLRLRLAPLPGDRLQVDVVKRRGGWPLAGLEVALSTRAQRPRWLREQLARWQQRPGRSG